jgi:hypothetical protein
MNERDVPELLRLMRAIVGFERGQNFRQIAVHARATAHERFCWFVLNDNVLAQSFYRGLGATEDPEWRRWIMRAATCRP